MASAWSLSADFSTINSYTVWSYGYKPPGYQVTGSFVLFTHLTLDPLDSGIIFWTPPENVPNPQNNVNPIHEDGPSISYNLNPITTILDVGSSRIIYPAHSINIHPSCDGKFSVARFTAPVDGNYALSVIFTHIDDHSNFTHTGGYIIYNNSMTLWETDIFGIGDLKSYESAESGITVKKNETIDFIIGNGLDNTCYYDSTLANVEIRLLLNNSTNKQPLMSTILFGFGLGLFCYYISYVLYSRYKHWKNTSIYEPLMANTVAHP
ncbi:17307_t:CDS:1 [Dentiscutata erythropus]|uniref:17307_t:CDS:1 n=1 Tax=Dentiscutata erythropus TaxID=1348616 RepID=A0A9N8WB92_9GLOM|nr:17307_t:CDS:1 [Dentiscutata erythropus]